jgi:Ferritin-like
VEEELRDVGWLQDSLQSAIDLEFATIPVYLSGLWSIEQQSGEVYSLVDSVVLEEMLHMGLACNMLTAIGGSPAINVPSYPGSLPNGVRPDLCVYLAGLSPTTVQMYMQIELPEHPVALAAETYPTIGAFYDAILSAFQTLSPTISQTGQLTADFYVPNPSDPSQTITEPLTVLASLSDVETAIATIKDQGEGTSTSPDAPEFGGELAHYYRFGEVYNGKQLIQVDGTGTWVYEGDPVSFPTCYPVALVPAGGYPGVQAVQAFDEQYTTLVQSLEAAWGSGGQSSLYQAIGVMGGLYNYAQPIVSTPLRDGSGNNYGPDFKLVQ